MDKILSHYQALEYTESVLSSLPGKFILGGHSKGGHLAFYTALNMKPELCDRLLYAISYDGPGFPYGIERFINYHVVKKKLRKYVTHRDMVGAIYHDIPNPVIVYSPGILLGGHDPFAWKVDNNTGKFITRKKVIKRATNFTDALNMWLDELSHEDKVLGCGAIFAITGKARNIYDLLKYFGTNLVMFNSVIKKYAKKDQERLRELIQLFFKCLKITKKNPQSKDI